MKATLLDLSTAHITEGTNALLHEKGCSTFSGVTVTNKPYGYFISFSTDEESLELVKGDSSIPRDLLELILFAASENIGFINLDQDAEIEKGLPTYEW